jgi:hypothetical protein
MVKVPLIFDLIFVLYWPSPFGLAVCPQTALSFMPPSEDPDGAGNELWTSQTLKNHQATMKTRYCGHLYSSLLRKRTWWGHRDQVSYYMEGGLKGTEGSPTPGGLGAL